MPDGGGLSRMANLPRVGTKVARCFYCSAVSAILLRLRIEKLAPKPSALPWRASLPHERLESAFTGALRASAAAAIP